MDEYGFGKFSLQRLEVGKSIERIASFQLQEHAEKFADSLLNETYKNQFLVIFPATSTICYVKQGIKKVKKLKSKEIILKDSRKL